MLDDKETTIIELFTDEPKGKEKEDLEKRGYKKITGYMKHEKN